MDKKPLIVVSILVGVLLILCSVSNVVGYQQVKAGQPRPKLNLKAIVSRIITLFDYPIIDVFMILILILIYLTVCIVLLPILFVSGAYATLTAIIAEIIMTNQINVGDVLALFILFSGMISLTLFVTIIMTIILMSFALYIMLGGEVDPFILTEKYRHLPHLSVIDVSSTNRCL